MALIKFGAMTTDARGTLAGIVFSRNGGGAYIRQKVSPIQPLTTSSGLSRSVFGSISQRWSTQLTDAQRAGWEAFAAVHTFVNVFGSSIVLTGIAFYQAVNKRLLQVGADYLDTAPSEFDVAALGSVVVSAHAAAGVLTGMTITVGRPLVYGEGLYVFGTPPILGARAVQKNMLRLINTPATGTFNNAADEHLAYQARFDPLAWATADRFAVRVAVLNEDTGAISPPVLVNALVS